MDAPGLGRVLVVLIGLGLWSGALNWFGKLPGDIRHEGESTRIYLPITSMLVISVALTLLVNLLPRFWR